AGRAAAAAHRPAGRDGRPGAGAGAGPTVDRRARARPHASAAGDRALRGRAHRLAPAGALQPGAGGPRLARGGAPRAPRHGRHRLVADRLALAAPAATALCRPAPLPVRLRHADDRGGGDDHRLGGVIMWVPSGLIPLAAFTLVFFRWVAAEADEVA